MTSTTHNNPKTDLQPTIALVVGASLLAGPCDFLAVDRGTALWPPVKHVFGANVCWKAPPFRVALPALLSEPLETRRS